MKNFWKKTAAGLMALLIVAGTSPVAPFSQTFERTAITASAAPGDVFDSGNCGKTAEDNVTWELTKNADDETKYTLTISGTGDIDAHPWHDYQDSITAIVIGSGVTSIGDFYFPDYTNLTTVTIKGSVDSIGEAAFMSCSSLTSVTIGGSVDSIGEAAFDSCSSLTSVTIGGSVKTIRDHAFDSCSSLTSVTIGGSVDSIGEAAFMSCGSLTSVTIGGSVDSIGKAAFMSCGSLTSVTIGGSVDSIGDGAFNGCLNVTSFALRADTPPAVGAHGIMDFDASILTIYVPVSGVEAYKAADDWSRYTDNITGAYFVSLPASTTGGTVTADKIFVDKDAADKTVTLTVTPASGYAVKSVKYNDTVIEPVEGAYSFTMPDEDVTVTAEFDKPISSASLTLGDDLGLNFYMSSAITDENAADYTVKFEGECLENEATLTKNESTGKYYATAHVYAKNLDKKIMAKLYKGEEVICTTEYSVSDYLENAPANVTDEKALALIKATKAFGAMSADYFYEGEHGFSAAYNEYLTQSGLTDADIISNAKNNYATEFTTDDAKISLVLDEKTAIRLYVKGVQPDGENLKPSKQANKDVYPSYYEIAGLTPDKLADEQTVKIGDKEYKFSALSWANRILDQEDPSEKNLNMAKAVTAYYLAAHDYYVDQHTVYLSQLTADYYAKDGDILTGTTDRRIYVSGVTVTLKDAEIQSHYILCSGNSTILLEGTNKAPIQINNGTLTIDGEGSLVANGTSYEAGIGGDDYGNLIINGGTITATGGSQAAGIGGNQGGNFGNITINGGIITANGDTSGCPGIGTGTNGGYYSKCGDITINGGTVTAIGTLDAPGIGSVYSKECGNITIADTVEKVTVIKGEDAPCCIGVDGCSQTKCGTITIGGNVYYENGAYVNGGNTYLAQDTIVYEVIDLSKLAEDYTAKNGNILTGELKENVKISIANGARVTLRDVTINGVNDEAYKWAGINCEGDAKLILEGENNVKGFYDEYPGVYLPENNTLTIDGEGELNASSNGWGAGIGGVYEINCGNIIIEGGTITANGGKYAAGIGSGYSAKCGVITINDGTVIANGGEDGAGIGSGYAAKCGDITINGGTITANGGNYAAGIGGAKDSNCGVITINDGTVTATGGEYAAGIGSGYYESKCGNITINGGTVSAEGGKYSAGIGSGCNGSRCGDITIADTVTKVTATKEANAPNSIGAGKEGTCGTVTIGNATGAVSESPYTYEPNKN